ncbi:hypothetical protein [Burkholderia sp. AU4i]|uniref:hypothetical protein n=1 Tax=Burkholderia sp. AU4i TaxID=1335308 RepID=UPI0012DFB8F1|nr:hypothetical protein [Burkholderia sp. AU4i]
MNAIKSIVTISGFVISMVTLANGMPEGKYSSKRDYARISTDRSPYSSSFSDDLAKNSACAPPSPTIGKCVKRETPSNR